MHRFFGEFNFQDPLIDLSTSDSAHQLIDVLKMKKGERVNLFNDEGQEATCVIDTIHKKAVIVRIENVETKPLSNRRVHLFCAVLKKDNVELVVQKGTEVGVTDFHPVITERTVKQGLRLDRLTRIAIEATEQSGRMLVPTIYDIEELENALVIAEDLPGTTMILDRSEIRIEAVLSKAEETVCLFVGPEGGWSERERKLFQDKGWPSVSLGKAIYRAETAAIVAGWVAGRF